MELGVSGEEGGVRVNGWKIVMSKSLSDVNGFLAQDWAPETVRKFLDLCVKVGVSGAKGVGEGEKVVVDNVKHGQVRIFYVTTWEKIVITLSGDVCRPGGVCS